MHKDRHLKTIAKNYHGPGAFLIRRPKIALLIGLTAAIWGLLSAITIPKESAPYIAFGVVNINTSFTGASAIDVDTLITQEIEEKIKNVSGINKYSSVSRNSLSSITIEFEPGQNMTKAMGDIRSKVDEAKPFLPAEIDNDPHITEIDSSLEPFLSILISGAASPLELTDTAEDLKGILENIPDVAQVNVVGAIEREIAVDLDRQKIESLGLSPSTVVNAIRSSHKDTPLGNFEIDNLDYSLRFEGKHKTAQDIQDIVIKDVGKDGIPSLITVGDIAHVYERKEDTNTTITRFIQAKKEQKREYSFGEKIWNFASHVSDGVTHLKVGVLIPLAITLVLFVLWLFPITAGLCSLPRWVPLSTGLIVLLFWFINSPTPVSFQQKNSPPQPAVELSVSRKSESDILQVDERTRKRVEKYIAEKLPSNMDIQFTRKMADTMRDDYKQVITSGLQSVLIVMLFIFFFVGVMEGLVASIVIPITFLVAIGVLALFGKTLNFMTNFSMILSLGILVDTAIVIVEGAHHFIKQGYSRREAALLTLHEYRGPLLSGTLTTLAVFIPLLSLSGILGQYLSFIPITVIIVLGTSLAVSLLLIPVYASKLLPNYKKIDEIEHTVGKTAEKSQCSNMKYFSRIRIFSRCFRKVITDKTNTVIKKYGKALQKFLSRRVYRLTILGGVVFLFFASFQIPLKFELFPQSDQPFLSISVDMPEGTTSKKTLIVAEEVEDVVRQYPEVLFVETHIDGKSADISIELLTEKKRKEKNMMSSVQLEKEFFKQTDSIAEKNMALIRARSAQNGPPSEFPVGFRIVARDREKISDAKALTLQLTEKLRKIPGTSGVKNNIEEIPGEFRFRVDRQKAISLGIDPDSVPGIIRTSLQGTTAATITRDGRDIDVVVQVNEKDIDTLQAIEDIRVYSINGGSIPIRDIVKIERRDALAAVRRSDGDIAFTVSSLLSETGNAEEVTNAFLEMITKENITIPDGIDIVNAGENEENADLMADLGKGFIIALLLMFLILVVQFNTYIQPLLILFTILFAQIGVSVGLWLTGTPRSLAYILGAIALAGIVVNDAIIMIDQMNKNNTSKKNIQETQPQEDSPLAESIVDAGTSRFIPVVLTTLTTSAGIIPLIFQDQFWAGLSYTIIFGLMVASFLTLFVTPITFYQFEKEKGTTLLFMLMIAVASNAVISLMHGKIIPGLIMIIVSLILYWIFQWLSRKTKKITP